MDNQCYECGLGKALDNNVCVGTLNCKNPEVICEACAPGFELKSDGKCYDVSEGCQKQGSTEGVCATCKPGFKMIGYRCIKQEVFVPYCYIYYNETSCEICKNGYSFFQNYCLLPVHIQGILNGSTTIEATIVQIRTEMGLTIVKTDAPTINTDAGTAPNQQQNITTPSTPSTPSNPSTPPNQPTTPANPNSQQGSTTALPPAPIAFCANQQGSICISCINGYVVSSNTCLPMDPNCSSYELASGKCVACIPGF